MINLQKIGYSGFATIKYYKGKDLVKVKKLKNKGTSLLFRLLSYCVCGQDVSSYVPKYIDIGTYAVTDSDTTFKSLLSYRVSLTSRVIKDVAVSDSEATVPFASSFTAFIPSRIILAPTDDSSDGGQINCLRLYNNYTGSDADGLLAQIDLTGEDIIKVTDVSQYSLMIEWIMTFGNMLRS